ncbi:serine hydrolase [Fulvivirgaceae bacterium BMA10]|uniref:Serine hydrolase n=1 Tax=Splendidivirga corallicola TaxID=3051826 RepID=A0ABT8KL04_9BACT|nr:serine hydrolase [Fulvivirgaceae bacterium BMA10]
MRKFKRIIIIVFLIAVGYGIFYLWGLIPIASAYSAKIMCSCVFVSGRDEASVKEHDLVNFTMVDMEVDQEKKTVESSIFGLGKRVAVYRKNLGCTLAVGASENELEQTQLTDLTFLPERADTVSWPMGDDLRNNIFPSNVNRSKLERAIKSQFEETDPDNLLRTRAVIVLYNGNLLAEHYADGYSKDTPLLGWSMTKSVVNALIGILVKQDKLAISNQELLAKWQEAQDPRREISLDQMLRMSSGLEFKEEYSTPIDVPKMLFGSYSASEYASEKELRSRPDGEWYYSSGTTNIVSKIIRNTFQSDLTYLSFPREALFNKLGMQSATMEIDASGSFVGSSFMYATARDWARFGLLYLNDGVWNNERILPEGWVSYSTHPTPLVPMGNYGAHWWLNAGDEEGNRKFPSLPQDAYYAAGHEGQIIMIVPSKKTVIVRLGLTLDSGRWDKEKFVKEVLESIEN